jgi:low affinity Fe/Cu permease
MRETFRHFANRTSDAAGSPWMFLAALLVIVLWGVTGPLFGFSDTWQLVINTGTTIVTFLMVFLIQNTQNRDNAAVQAKLDELIRASKAKNEFIGIEHLSDEELDEILEKCEQHRPDVLRRAEQRASAKRKAQLAASPKQASRRARAPSRKRA